jgi:hypothetical protein
VAGALDLALALSLALVTIALLPYLTLPYLTLPYLTLPPLTFLGLKEGSTLEQLWEAVSFWSYVLFPSPGTTLGKRITLPSSDTPPSLDSFYPPRAQTGTSYVLLFGCHRHHHSVFATKGGCRCRLLRGPACQRLN